MVQITLEFRKEHGFIWDMKLINIKGEVTEEIQEALEDIYSILIPDKYLNHIKQN